MPTPFPRPAAPGTVAVWGSETPYENDFIFNPYGNGWHIDRSRFDAMLARAAEEAGATVSLSARVISCFQQASVIASSPSS